jgi:hypothetical protein
MVTLTADIKIAYIYTLMPAFLVSAGGFYIISTGMDIRTFPLIVLSIAGGVAASATVVYTISPAGLGRGIIFLTVGVLIIYLQRDESGRSIFDQTLFAGVFVSVMLSTFFWYLPHFIKISGILILVGVLAAIFQRQFTLSISLTVIAVLIGLLIFEIPLVTYLSYLKIAITRAIELNFGLPTGANQSPHPTAYSPKYYSLLPLLILAPTAVAGGLLAIREVLFRESRSVAVVAVSWGIAVLSISGLYLATSSSFLVGRTYLLAFPVMVVGAAFAVERTSMKTQTFISGTFLILVFSALFLQAGLPAVQVQSYEPGIAEGSQWIGSNVNRNVVTDLKRGAPMAATGEFNSVYPQDYPQVQALFYTENYTRFSQSTNRPVVLSEGMTVYGLYVLKSNHKPISQSAYEVRITRSNVPYTNGEVRLVIPRDATSD